MLEPGTKFDRYEIQGLLGEGGMGLVFRARDPKLERPVALKLVHVEQGLDREADILREARAAAALHHPNTVAIYDVGAVEGQPFIAMELVEGVPLDVLVHEQNAPLAERIEWLGDVARALAAAHRAGLVHRDVKPDNVMVRSDGVVKVLDFGIARRLDAEGVQEETSFGDRVRRTFATGTPMYMAPEQLLALRLDGRSDQFSWGVMAYELLVGQHPWAGHDADPLSLAHAVLKLVPRPAASLDPRIPVHVSKVVNRAMSKEPKNRYPTMDALLDELAPDAVRSYVPPPRPVPSAPGFASGRVTVRTDPSAIEAAPTLPARRVPRKRARAIAAVGLATGLAAAALLGWSLHRQEPSPTVPTSAADPNAAHPKAAEAEQAYLAGREAWRRGEASMPFYERAVELDPAHAGAQLWLATLSLDVAWTEARRRYKLASDHRERLDERARVLFEVLEPYLRRDPPDMREMTRRAREAAARHPDDADVQLVHARTIQENPASRYDDVIAAFERVLSIDRRYAPAWHFKAMYQARSGRMDAAVRTLESCLAQAGGNPRCLRFRQDVDRVAGRCDRLADDAHRLQALDPDNPSSYEGLAEALVAAEQYAAARQVFVQKWARWPEATRRYIQRLDEARLAVLQGDFGGAEESLASAADLVATRPDEADHARPFALRIELALETGRPEVARALARAFAERRKSLMRSPWAHEGAVGEDPTPAVVAAERAAGGLDGGKARERILQWARRWGERGGERVRVEALLHGLAATAQTEREARTALEQLGAIERISPMAPSPVAAPLGKLLFLAGREGEAVERIEGAAGDCRVLGFPLHHVRSNLLLGIARERSGDRAGACAAFSDVIRHWGAAQPASLTAREAARGAARLRCN